MRSETQLVLEAARDELMQQVEQAAQQTTEMVAGFLVVLVVLSSSREHGFLSSESDFANGEYALSNRCSGTYAAPFDVSWLIDLVVRELHLNLLRICSA